MPGGLTSAGYSASTVQEEVDDLNAQFLANVDGALDLSPDQPIGQIIAIFAEKFVPAMELGATVYNALNPGAAEGQLLANVCAISGTFPQVATYSKVTANLSLNAVTTVHAGATAQVAGQPQNIWVLEADAVNAGASPAVISATFRGQTAGPQVANAGTLTVIGTPTPGWTAITNPADAIPGLAADTDTTLRAKRLIDVLGEGAGDLDSIRAAVAKVGGVITVFVFENTSLVIDGNGLPGKAFRVVIWDGLSMAASNDNVAQAIWNTKPSGILAYGRTNGNAIDSLGNTRVMSFDRASQVPVYVSVNTNVSLTTPQITAIKASLAAFAEANWGLGESVVWNALFAPVQSVIGVQEGVKISTLFIDITPSPVATSDITISPLQIATLSTTNIKVNGV